VEREAGTGFGLLQQVVGVEGPQSRRACQINMLVRVEGTLAGDVPRWGPDGDGARELRRGANFGCPAITASGG